MYKRQVYQQKPLPTTFAGVEVTISVIDANQNYRTIGTTTTDASGTYGLQWTPDIEGKYTVIASFAGTNGYWPSKAQTYFAVDPTQVTPAPDQAQQTSLADQYFMPAVVAIILVIIIIGAIILLMLRRIPQLYFKEQKQ